MGSFCKCLLLSCFQIVYKKGHDERKSKYTSLPDPPDVEQAKKVTRQLSDVSRMQFSSFNRNFHFGIREERGHQRAKEKTRPQDLFDVFSVLKVSFYTFWNISENPGHSQVKDKISFLPTNLGFVKHFCFYHTHIHSYSSFCKKYLLHCILNFCRSKQHKTSILLFCSK